MIVDALKYFKILYFFYSRFHGYDAMIPKRISKFDSISYEFKLIVWKKDIVSGSYIYSGNTK